MPSGEATNKGSRFLSRLNIRDHLDERPSTPCSGDSPILPSSGISHLLRRRQNIPIAYSVPLRREQSVPEPEPEPEPVPEPEPEPMPAPASSNRILEWRPMENDAIHQWREITATYTRPHRRSVVQSNSPRNEAGFSGSEDSILPSKKPRDATAYLKYLVRGFLKQFRAASADTDSSEGPSSKECFVPSPKITFLIDEPNNLVCQICQQAPLRLAITAENPRPGTTAVQPRLIAQDTIHTLPDTLANGGKIGSSCFRCAERDRREISVERWTDLAEKFRIARREAERLGTDEAKAEMCKAQKDFERVPEDDFWVLTRMRHRQW
ncbi:putative ring finger protein [Rosellinia necatrix]|uniref:Putative ring finger protein n=1 Tax=Rosellinia necatrix TaxID=77044 RepID=A0A1S8A711_ROSNE|nr:putative ring finger protein [Rosellinia necatrix]